MRQRALRPATSRLRRLASGLLLLGCCAIALDGHAGDTERDPISGARASVEGDWVQFETGSDESAQTLRLRIWGTLREPSFFSHGFHQLDADPELEYVVISRNEGTGPYYKLQIIDVQPRGILTWSYDSYESPEVGDGGVELGLPSENGGPPRRERRRLTVRGLEKVP